MRRCTSCGVDKQAAEFSADKLGRDGLKSVCRVCAVARAKAWRHANPERDRAASRAYRRRNRQKVNARNALRYAVRVGNLVKRPCEVCGSADDVHGHHHDYGRPLDVRWLCRTHHNELENARGHFA